MTAHTEGVVAGVEAPQRGMVYTWTITGGTFVSEAVGTEVTFDVGEGPEVVLEVTAENARGKTRSASHRIDVAPLPDATIEAPQWATAGADGLEASVPAQEGMTYRWEIARGTIVSGQGTHAIVFAAGDPGELIIEVEVTNAAGDADRADAVVKVVAPPDASLEVAPGPVTEGTEGLVASVPAQEGMSYLWTVEGGTITTGQGTSSIVFSAGEPGVLEVAVVVANAAGTAATAISTLEVVPLPDATITAPAGPVTEGTEGLVASVPAQEGMTFQWTVMGGTITDGEGTHEIVFSAHEPGLLLIDVLVTNAAGTQASDLAWLEVVPAPNASINTRPYVTDQGTGVASVPLQPGATFEWTVVGGTILSGEGTEEISYRAENPVEVEIGVRVRNLAGDEASDSVTVGVVPPPVASIETSGAPFEWNAEYEAWVDEQPGAVYFWTVRGGTVVQDEGARIRFVVDEEVESVSLAVMVYNLAFDFADAAVEIRAYPPPDATITAPSHATLGGWNGASVPEQPEMSYSWDIEGGIIVEGQGEHWITFRAGEVEHVRLSVRVDSPAGTYATSEVVIPTLVIPEAKITTVTGPVAMGRTGLQASVPKQPLVTYYWEVVNGTIEEGQRSHAMTFTAGDPGNVTVRVYVYSPSHATATGQKTIPVRAEPDVAFSVQATAFPGEQVPVQVPLQVGATYDWTVTGGAILSGQGTHELLVEAGSPGSMRIELAITSGAGVVGAHDETVEIHPPAEATISGPAYVHTEGVATVSVPEQRGATVLWTVENGSIVSQDGMEMTLAPAGPGTVRVQAQVQGGNGDVADGTFELLAVPPPDATIAAPSEIPTGKIFTVSVAEQPGQSYAWSIVGGEIVSGQGSRELTFQASEPGTLVLSVQVENVFGEVADDAADVEVRFGSFRPTGSMAYARANAEAVTLNDGRVLVMGGRLVPGYASVGYVEAYDPQTETFNPLPEMHDERYRFTATLLQDGRVLAVGGIDSPNTAEIFDPVTNTWDRIASPLAPRWEHTATLLPDGRVLVVGGEDPNSTNSAEIFDPLSETWSWVSGPQHARASHGAGLLADGRVLVVGSKVLTPDPGAEVYDPSTDAWSVVPGLQSFYLSSVVVLSSGEALVSGGRDDGRGATTSTQSYTAATGSFSPTASMVGGRAEHASFLLPDGKALFIGGYDEYPWQSTYYEGGVREASAFDPVRRTQFASMPMGVQRHAPTVALLPDGRVLVAGGEEVHFQDGEVVRVSLRTAELFEY